MVIKEKDYTRVSILVVGAGPGGLAAAIAAKSAHKDADVVVLEKGDTLGNNNLSGAVLETASLKRLFDEASPDWLCMEGADHIMGREVKDDDVCFLLGKKFAINISPLIKLGKKLGLSFGEMDNSGDHIVSICKLTRFLGKIALSLGIEVYTGFGVKEILYDQTRKEVYGVKLVDQGLDKEGRPQP
ncbi:MAG TPA: NAD(P)/FAD-dependent oxidoreductase, partial [Candidatus Wunengus sp. YC64]